MAEIWPDEGLDIVLTYFPKNTAPAANTWMALFTSWSASTVGTNTDTRANYPEPGTGLGAYARQTISSTSWGATAGATGGRKTTAGQVTYPTATASWGTINGFTIANSATTAAGSLFFAANFDDTTAVAIASNDVIKVTPTIQYNQQTVADNLGVTPGSGATMRTKELSAGIHAQVVGVLTTPPTILSGNQQLSVTTASDTTLSVPTGGTHALMTVDSGGGDIRYWEDGSSPTSTTGLLVPATGAAELTNLTNVKMRSTTGTVVVHVSYRKYA